MCDESKLREWANQGLSRRNFGILTGAAAVAACTSGEAPAEAETETEATPEGLTETPVSFATADGTMDGLFIHPDEGKHPGVIFWPDIASIRKSKREMARRLAGEGYAVLLLNPYYRDVEGEQFADFKAFIGDDGFDKTGPWRSKFNADAVGRDTKAAVAWLDQQDAVDTDKGIGTQGYCMTGSFTVWAAAAVPERIKAAASFHGGRLVQEDNPKSPHNLLGDATASFLIAVAQDDDASSPETKTKFAEAAERVGRDARVDVYEGDHGWTVLDSPAYAEPAAEKAYADLLSLYEEAL